MIRGVVKKYKPPISYTFCKSTTNSYDLASQSENVLQAVNSKLVFELWERATNTAGISILKNDTKRSCCQRNVECKEEFYDVDCGEDVLKLIHLYDPPHLLKGTRNN